LGVTVDGLVLCTAGEHRLAFSAHEVTGIDIWAADTPGIPYARTAWQLPPAPGRLLVQDDSVLVVDTLEVSAESVSALDVPPSLQQAAGGALAGFFVLRGQLWPLLGVSRFARFLEALTPAGATT
jgi:hypothetical protein